MAGGKKKNKGGQGAPKAKAASSSGSSSAAAGSSGAARGQQQMPAAPGQPGAPRMPQGAPYPAGGYPPSEMAALQQALSMMTPQQIASLMAAKGLGKGGKGLPMGDDEYDDESDEDGYSQEDDDMQHFADVCYSLVNYWPDAKGELEWKEKEIDSIVDPEDRALLMPVVTTSLLQEMRRCARINAEFLAMLVRTDEEARQFGTIPNNHVVQDRNSVKVRTVLRQFVRDWAVEGARERDEQYGCLLEALQRYIPLDQPSQTSQSSGRPGGRPRVVAPGSGLARLPYEIAKLGYVAQGNEFSYHMLQGSKWVLNETSRPNMCNIYPFVLSLENRRGVRDHLRPVSIPDVCPSDALCPGNEPQSELSMCAGEFVEVYAPQSNAWDAVLTCFFLDTAKNVFLYIRTIAGMTRPGGLWANIGPLLYHYAEQADSISIELSWEELKPAIEKYFDFKEEDVREAYYTTNVSGMFHTRYRCKYFAAIRNDRPVEGKSLPVFGSQEKQECNHDHGDGHSHSHSH